MLTNSIIDKNVIPKIFSDENGENEDKLQQYLMWSEVDPEAMIEFSLPQTNAKILKSQSEPDLVHLLNEATERPHPSSRVVEGGPVKRQKTWHPILHSIKRSNGGAMTSPTEEITSFV